jgi:hypothetical protein
VLDVGDSDGLGVGCAIADDIEPKSIIAAAVANLMMSPMRGSPGLEFALKTDVLTSSSVYMWEVRVFGSRAKVPGSVTPRFAIYAYSSWRNPSCFIKS